MTSDPASPPRSHTAGSPPTRSHAVPARAHASPASGIRRLELLDALRGFALLGVLMVNLRSFSLFEFLTPSDRAALPTAAWDRMVDMAMALLVDARSITLFSLLFGVGFAMQMNRPMATQNTANHVRRRYVRRMLILLAIGLVHAWLFWWGDILRYYAVFGLALLAFTRLSPRMLAALGVFVAVAMPVLLQPVLPPLLPSQASPAQSAAAALAAFSSDRWSTVLDGNFARDARMRIAVWWLPLFVFGRLLIGMAIGRAGVLQRSLEYRHFWRRLLYASLATSLVATVLLLLRDHNAAGTVAEWLRGGDVGKTVTRLLRHIAPLAQGVFYMAAFVLLFQRAAWRHWLRKLAPMGRMALTNYLAQTLFGLGLFYGIGLGIGPRLGLVGIAACSIAIFALQAAFSCWWLARFRFGPAEWLWRSLVYGKPQPMRWLATA